MPPDSWGEWRSVYNHLTDFNRWLIRLAILNRLIRRRLILPFPIRFSLIASLLSFAALAVLPVHPMTIPTAFGLGLSIALIAYAKKSPKERPI